jgi:hypothetical protein
MVGIVIVLAVIALSISTILIQLFGNADGDNFWLNLVGVAIGAVIILTLLRNNRDHEFMYEVIYVWDLKQVLNRIYRKQKQIKAAIETGDQTAMVIMNWSYNGSEQLYNLDNNTITMEDLHRAMRELQQVIEQHDFTVSTDDFKPEMLDKY